MDEKTGNQVFDLLLFLREEEVEDLLSFFDDASTTGSGPDSHLHISGVNSRVLHPNTAIPGIMALLYEEHEKDDRVSWHPRTRRLLDDAKGDFEVLGFEANFPKRDSK